MTEVARLLKEQLAGNPCSLWSELKDFMCFFSGRCFLKPINELPNTRRSWRVQGGPTAPASLRLTSRGERTYHFGARRENMIFFFAQSGLRDDCTTTSWHIYM